MPPKKQPDLPLSLSPAAEPPPADWVAVAEVGAPIGLKGAVRIHTFHSVTGISGPGSILGTLARCWLKKKDGTFALFDVIACTPQTRGEKLLLKGITDRDQAQSFVGCAIGVSRSDFPPPGEDETYWADLLGCRVINRASQDLGQIQSMQSNGEHDWMVLPQGWIPFVAKHVDRVDVAGRVVYVDWESDWF